MFCYSISEKILKLIFLKENFSLSYYVGLSLTEPSQDGTGITEPSDPSYSRKEIEFTTITNGIQNLSTVEFPEASQDWGEIKYFVIFSDDEEALMYGQLLFSLKVSAGSKVKFLSGSIKITINDDGISDYLQEEVAKILAGEEFTPPEKFYLGISVNSVSGSDTGSSIIEPSGYERKEVEFNVNNNLAFNSTAVEWEVEEGWGSINSVVILDSQLGGEIYFYYNFPSPVEISDDYVVSLDSSAFLVSID